MAAAAKKPVTLDAIHAAGLADRVMGKYATRRKNVYSAAKKLVWSGTAQESNGGNKMAERITTGQRKYAEASTVVINVPGPAAGAPGVAIATDNVPEGALEPNPDGSVNAYDEAGLKVGTVDAATAEAAAAGVDAVIVEGGQAARNEQQDGANG